MPRVSLTSGVSGVVAMLQRVLRIDAASLARLRQRGDFVDVFVQTPFGVLASRAACGEVAGGGLVVPAGDFLGVLAEASGVSGGVSAAGVVSVDVPDAGVLWPGLLPPGSGFVLVDEVPAGVVADLARQGSELVRQFSGPLGPPVSLLDQVVLRVRGAGSGEAVEVEIPMRMVFACVNLGFVPRVGVGGGDVPRHLRVSACGRWVRMDAAFGTVWFSRGGLSLL